MTSWHGVYSESPVAQGGKWGARSAGEESGRRLAAEWWEVKSRGIGRGLEELLGVKQEEEEEEEESLGNREEVEEELWRYEPKR